MEPTTGVDTGGAVVRLVGNIASSGDIVQCKFGQTLLMAMVQSGSLVSCLSPVHTAGNVTVSLSTNGVDFTSGGMQYVYEAGPTVSAVKLHAAASSDADTQTIAVSGRHFALSPLLMYSVGARAEWMSSSLVLCTADTASLGNMTVEVSNNGQDFSADGIEFLAAPRLGLVGQVRMSPSTGPANGGTLVTLSGTDWQALVETNSMHGWLLSHAWSITESFHSSR